MTTSCLLSLPEYRYGLLGIPAKPTPAEFERLKAEHQRIRRDLEAMRETAREMRRELHTQLARLAEMQAGLEEKRHH